MTRNKEWIEWVWTAEKPYPETLDTMVCVKIDGYEHSKEQVGFWVGDSSPESSNWFQRVGYFCTITHYKLA